MHRTKAPSCGGDACLLAAIGCVVAKCGQEPGNAWYTAVLSVDSQWGRCRICRAYPAARQLVCRLAISAYCCSGWLCFFSTILIRASWMTLTQSRCMGTRNVGTSPRCRWMSIRNCRNSACGYSRRDIKPAVRRLQFAPYSTRNVTPPSAGHKILTAQKEKLLRLHRHG